MKLPDIKERLEFITVYDEFGEWLNKLGFEFVQSNTPADVLYEMYKKEAGDDTMFGVECIKLQTLGLTIRFVRARETHLIVITNIYGIDFVPYNVFKMSISETKDLILQLVRTVRDRKLNELKPFENL